MSNKFKINKMRKLVLTTLGVFLIIISFAQGTRLLRQPTISETHVAFSYGGDIWATDFENQQTIRLTSTGAVETNPHFFVP